MQRQPIRRYKMASANAKNVTGLEGALKAAFPKLEIVTAEDYIKVMGGNLNTRNMHTTLGHLANAFAAKFDGFDEQGNAHFFIL